MDSVSLISFAMRFVDHRLFHVEAGLFVSAGITQRTVSAAMAKLLFCVLSLGNGIC
jgi:hypothetical protein